MVIFFLSCRNLPRPENRAPVLSPGASKFKSTAVLPYVKGLSEQLRRCLQQQGIRAVSKSETTLRSHLIGLKTPLTRLKKMAWFTEFPVNAVKSGRPVQFRIKEHDRNIRFTRTQTSANSEHAHNTGQLPLWDEVKFIDRDPHCYTHRVKAAIHIRLHPNNINRDSGIEIPEAWMPKTKKQQHDNRTTADHRGNDSSKQRGSKCANRSC